MPVLEKEKDLIDLGSSPRRTRGSRSGSKLGTPLKKTGATPSPKKRGASKQATPSKSPSKGKNSLALEEIQDLPLSIVDALYAQGFTTISDFKGITVEKLEAKLQPVLFKDPSDPRQELAQKMQKEILSAWLRFLLDKSNQSSNKQSSWRDFVDTKKLDGMTAKGLIEAESFLKALRPTVLIRQRSALKKVGKPRSKQISFSDLKAAKGRLMKIPKGEALARKVNGELLSKAKTSLRPTGRK